MNAFALVSKQGEHFNIFRDSEVLSISNYLLCDVKQFKGNSPGPHAGQILLEGNLDLRMPVAIQNLILNQGTMFSEKAVFVKEEIRFKINQNLLLDSQ